MRGYKNKVFIFLILSLTFSLKTSGKSPILQGQTARLTFNSQGDMIYIYRNVEEKINLYTLKFQTENSFSKIISLGEKAFSPLIKRDRKGQIWIAWEEWEYNQSRIFLGQLKEDKIIHSRIIHEEEGFNLSPDLSFDLDDNPWITWINYNNSSYRVFAKEIFSNKTWIINPVFHSSAFTPKIIIDFNNQVWVFWSGKDKEENILYRRFNQDDWSPLGKINDENKFPQLSPSIAIDRKGFIWVVWSGYDGQDYEIYCTFWDREKWTKKIIVTHNSQKNDVFPSLSVVSDDFPIVAWTQSGEKGSHIYIKYLEHSSWSKSIKISSSRGQNIFPRMEVEGEKIGIIWHSDDEIEARLFSFSQLKEANIPGASLLETQKIRPPTIIYNPSLDEEKYIGFGDSITYGYIHYEPAPDKGYLPRLESLLYQNFGDTEVVNEGWPGETTDHGLSRIDRVISNHSARYLLLMEGTNDVVFNEISMDTTAFNLEEMIKRCLDFGVFPAIATIIPRKDWRWYHKFYRDRIFYLNDKIWELAQDFPIPLVDQFNLFYNYPEEEGGWKSLLSDYNHPTEEGYQLMAEEWFEEIRNFPFPPVNLEVERTYDEILFYRELGNHISWHDNPKIYDRSLIKGYKIYRKKIEEGDDQFELLTIIYQKLDYFDKDISPSAKYSYTVSSLRTDDVEGPCSQPEEDQ